jgi:hypothetical protein
MVVYSVLIADVRGSRRMDSNARYEGQLFLKSAISQINENYTTCIEAPFTITRGDEFQGVLNNLTCILPVVLEFERLLFPLSLWYGIGTGTIQRMGSDLPLEMDGQAFHRASEALLYAKKKKRQIVYKSDQDHIDLLVNTVFMLIHAIKRRWNQNNYERYWQYKALGTCEKVAEYENVSTQAIWDSIHNSRAFHVIQSEQALIDFFKSNAD